MLYSLMALVFLGFPPPAVVESHSERWLSASADGTHLIVTTRTTKAHPKRGIDGGGPVARAFCLLKEEWSIRAGLFEGKVTGVTGDELTVRCGSGFSRTFAVSPDVASQKIPLTWEVGSGHRLRQVRAGDKVGFRVVPTSRGPVVVSLGIYRRPGGKIPPAEDDQLPEHCRIHNRWNTEQFIEEKILPSLPWVLLFLHQ